MLLEQVEELGHALSKVVQHRYCWLTMHVMRGIFLHLLDSSTFPTTARKYSFSEEEDRNGAAPVVIDHVIIPLLPQSEPMAEWPDGRVFDHTSAREITRTAMRASILAAVQTCIEYHKISEIIATESPEDVELFLFLRQARNIVLHADGIMRKRDLKGCTWRGVTIANDGRKLKLNDSQVRDLLDDVVEALARLYVGQGKRIDYVTANLGYSVPFIAECADRIRTEGELVRP